MNKKNIIVIGASAGGFEALKKLTGGLPSDLDAAIFIVWHLSPDLQGILPQVLNNQNTLFASHATDGEDISSNRIYIAPPDKHLLLEDGFMRISRGPKENRFRPAVDPLFRSAAYIYGTRVIGIILSGALNDGTAGLWTIKSRGGTAIVQDPKDAEVKSMPENALGMVDIDYSVPISEMAALLTRLVTEDAPVLHVRNEEDDNKLNYEIQIAKAVMPVKNTPPRLGTPTIYACPECHGVLSAIREGKIMRYRCHTGHAYTSDTLLASVTESIEHNLWSAFRAMEENIILLNSLGDHYAGKNDPKHAAAYFIKARKATAGANLVRRALEEHEQLTTGSIRKEAENLKNVE